MLTLYKTAAECDFLDAVDTDELRFPVATFGLEDYATGLLARFKHRTLGFVVAYVAESGDIYYTMLPTTGYIPAAHACHDEFMRACKDMISLQFNTNLSFPTWVVKAYLMERR